MREWYGRRQHERPQSRPAALRIYEAHVGMSSEAPEVASYTYFKGGHRPARWPAIASVSSAPLPCGLASRSKVKRISSDKDCVWSCCR